MFSAINSRGSVSGRCTNRINSEITKCGDAFNKENTYFSLLLDAPRFYPQQTYTFISNSA